MWDVLPSTEWNSESSILIQLEERKKKSNIGISLTDFLCEASNDTDVKLVPFTIHKGVLLAAQQY